DRGVIRAGGASSRAEADRPVAGLEAWGDQPESHETRHQVVVEEEAVERLRLDVALEDLDVPPLVHDLGRGVGLGVELGDRVDELAADDERALSPWRNCERRQAETRISTSFCSSGVRRAKKFVPANATCTLSTGPAAPGRWLQSIAVEPFH